MMQPQPKNHAFRWATFWWTLAVVLHITALGAIVWYSPLREYLFGRDRQQTLEGVKGERMREIVAKLLEAHTRYVREKMAEQQQVYARLAGIRDDRYRKFVEQAESEIRQGFATPKPDPLDVLGARPSTNAAPFADRHIAEMYGLARGVERDTNETYRQLRAIELARIQGISLSDAGGATQVVPPVRPELRREVFGYTVHDGLDPRLQELKDEILKIRMEVSDMVAAAKRMLDTALELEATDLLGSQLMRLSAGGHFTGVGAWGSNIGPPMQQNEIFRRGGTESDLSENWAPVPGRKFMDDGRRADWMFIDTWYIIGPFPNPNRMNLDKKFPPESEAGASVDLDATYVGKDGVRLKWEFTQSNRPMIVPRVTDKFAIWYAFTELYSDRERDLHFFFGSDDFSRVWLNGEKVWSSGVTPHRWIPDRGMVKLHLLKGFNRMLVKIENGPGTMGFSVAAFLGATPGSGAAGAAGGAGAAKKNEDW